MKIAGMASNRGRNLRHIADVEPGGAVLDVVLTNQAEAPVLEAAAERGIATEVVERDADEPRERHERRIIQRLEGYDVDLICLDGYMRILTGAFLETAPTTLNVHPSLLPAFPGMDAHEQVLDAGVAVTGCTVHVVDETVDGGPIVTQDPVPVYDGDDAADLKERVRQGAEFRAYPRAIRWFAEDRVTVEDGAVSVADDDGRFPARRVASGDRDRPLRYGENPHQSAAVYADLADTEASVVGAVSRNAPVRMRM